MMTSIPDELHRWALGRHRAARRKTTAIREARRTLKPLEREKTLIVLGFWRRQLARRLTQERVADDAAPRRCARPVAWRSSAPGIVRRRACRPARASSSASPPLHHLHHLLRLLELVEQLVHFLHRNARAGRDAALARRLDELGLRALLARHRVDDAFGARDLLLVDLAPAAPPARAAPAACRPAPTRPPIFRICTICALKSSRSKPLPRLDLLREPLRPRRRRPTSAPPRPATARRPCRGCATPCGRDGTARGRRASRDTPTNLIGSPVTWRTDSAAPPRESPSSLVRTTPVSGSASPNALRRVDRVLPLHRIDDEQRLDRLHRRVQLARSRASSPRRCRGGPRCRRSARRDSAGARSRRARCAMSTGFCAAVDGKKSTPTCARQRLQLLDRRGPIDVGADQQHLLLRARP